MKKEMLINVLQPEECRIAIVEDGVLEELYVERASQESYIGNIYKGRIVNIEPSIQAAFVDFGIGRNGFLHLSDVDPVYYKHLLPKEVQEAMDAEDDPPPRQRPERDRERGRGPRVTRPESVQDRPTPVAKAKQPPVRDDDAYSDDDDEPFGTGLIEGGVQPEAYPERADLETEVASHSAPAQRSPVDDEAEEEDETSEAFGLGLVEPEPETDSDTAESVIGEADETETVEAELCEVDSNSAVEVDEAPEQPPAKIRSEPEQPVEPVASFDDDDFSDFGAGLDLDDEPNPDPTASARLTVKETMEDAFESGMIAAKLASESGSHPDAEAETKDNDPSDDEGEPTSDEPQSELPTPEVAGDETEPEETATEEVEAKPAKPKARRSRAKPKEAKPEAEVEAKPKRPRRTAKKKATDKVEAEQPEAATETPEPGTGDSADQGDNDQGPEPRVMGGAERRTSAEDEPEIRPFFSGGPADEFDINAPNDRFADGDSGEDGDDAPIELETATAEPEPFDLSQFENEKPKPARSRDIDDDDPEPFARPRRGGNNSGGRGGNRQNRRGGNNNNGRGMPRESSFPKPPIQEIFKRGQEVIVQVIKEGIGTKGPTLSTFISIAGRYLVLMPSLKRVGVSRKIEDQDARRRLRDIMNRLSPPKGVGFIVRTAAIEQNEEDLANDLQYLLRLWQVVVKRIRRMPSPVEIYRESDIITRTIRDILTPDVDTIWVDEENSYSTASDFLQFVMPKFANRIKLYTDTEPLFNKFGIEDEIGKINHKRIDLPQGGSIIIEQTEALVAIDVNSGTFRADNNAEETAFRMNMLAAKEIARQLRLRDLGGVIVNDFIDMRDEKHRRKVEDCLRSALERDRARTKILRISQFGIIEMTRQRIQPSLKKRVYLDCPHCSGTGYIKTNETMAIEIMRLLQLASHRAPVVATVQLTVTADVAFYLLNRKRKAIADLEQQSGIQIQIHGQFGGEPELVELKAFDQNGTEVKLVSNTPSRMIKGPMPKAISNRPQNLD